MHIAIKKQKKMPIYLNQKAQIKTQNLAKAHSRAQSEAQIRVLSFNISFITILAEYSNHSNVFSVENVAKLLLYNKMSDYTIKLEKDK